MIDLNTKRDETRSDARTPEGWNLHDRMTMNCSPILTAAEFSDVHNAKCELHGILQSMEGVVHPKIEERLKKAIELLNKGLANAYDQDEAAYQASETHFEEVERELGGLKSIWSMHEIKDLRASHPWPEHQLVTYQGWGEGEVKVRIEGPLWKDLWVAADKAILASGDGHHIFIEGFSQSKTRDFELCLSTGS